jgi:hypothetical protein
MLSEHRLRLLLSTLVFVSALLGCGFIQKMGTLMPNSEPVQFVGKGETDQIWEASVRSNILYELSVTPITYDNGAAILVCGRSGDICPENLRIASIHSLQNGASLSFSVDQNQQVYIHVTAGIGESGEETGTFLIELHEVE